MATFKIPKGKTYEFGITVLQKDSYLPKDLANMDTVNSSFILTKLDTLANVTGAITMTRVADLKAPGHELDPDTYLNGKLLVTIPAVVTETLAYDRGSKIDDYYLKPTYQGLITVVFTDDTDIVSVVNDIAVVPLGA